MTLPTYSTGTASVAAGGTVVTGAGGLWSGTNVKQGDFLSINGLATVLITEVTDSTHLKIEKWTGAAQTTQPYVIYQNYVGRVVGVAAAEDVGDMLEKLHVDGLPFIVDPALTVPDPSYGDDGQMAFQPSTGKWWTKTGGVWVLSPGLSSDSSKVLKAGDTMTGNLWIDKSDPAIILNKSASGQNNSLNGLKAGAARWALSLGDTTAETGSGNIGSNFAIYSYNDAGTFIGTPLHINRATGATTLTGAVFTPSGASFGNVAGPWAPATPLCSEIASAGVWSIASKSVDRGVLYLMTGSPGPNYYGFFTQGTVSNTVGSISGTTTTTTYATTSDGRRKPTREPFNGLDIINALNPVLHNWDNEPDQWAYGVIAQEAVDVLPQMIVQGDGDANKKPGDEGFIGWGADYSQAVPVLIRAVQELSEMVAALQARLAERDG